MKIGLKTIVSFFVMLLSLLTCVWVLFNSPQVYWDMQPIVGFTIGVFSVLFSHLFCKFWEMDEKSHYGLFVKQGELKEADQLGLYSDSNLSIAIGPAHEPLWELPMVIIRFCYFLAFFAISIMLIDNRSLFLAANFPETLKGRDEFCPEELEKPIKKVIKPGCDLVMKAFEMGYAKDLGDCDPSIGEDGKKQEEPKVCEKRRRDEPYPHFALRLLGRFYDRTFPDDIAASGSNSLNRFIKQTEKIEVLAQDQATTLTNAPRSSHSIFTNFPHPKGVVYGRLDELLPIEACQQKFARSPSKYMGDPKHYAAESKLLEHSLGALMFSQTHESSAGFCPDYQIVWDSPVDSCVRLAENPESFLDDMGLKQRVDDVMARKNLKFQLAELKRELKALDKSEMQSEVLQNAVSKIETALKKSETSEEDLQRYISFHCLNRSQDAQELVRREHIMNYRGHEFTLVEITVPQVDVKLLKGGEVFRTDYYQHVGQMLSPNFSNVGFESEANTLDTDVNKLAKELYKDSDFLFTKLQLLEHVDIFQEQDWIKSETGILDIYPWQLHEANFVERFRNTYKIHRGRL